MWLQYLILCRDYVLFENIQIILNFEMNVWLYVEDVYGVI